MDQLAQLNPEVYPHRGKQPNPPPPPAGSAPASASPSSLPAALPHLEFIAKECEDARMLSSRRAAEWFHQVQGIVWRQVKEAQYKTNDLVELVGGLDKRDKRELYLNNLRTIKVGRVELLFLLVLAFAALTRAGLPTPWRVEAKKDFLTWDQIADEIIRLERGFPVLKGVRDLTYTEIARAAWRLRKKIKAAGGNRDLIETGVIDRGYRLSSHPINFRILVREFNIAGPFSGFAG
jgi:hypothetical protein